jgi:hypothetical protein
MFEHRILRGLMLAMALALLVALLPTLALAERHSTPSGPGPQAVGHTTITGDPLTIHVAADTSIQVFHAGKPDGQVQPPGYDEADSGAFMWWGPPIAAPLVYGPAWALHDASSGNPVVPWLPISQSTVGGSGTPSDPWEVTTKVWAAGLDVFQWIRYVDGDSCFRVMYTVNNLQPSGGTEGFTFFHAADLWPDDSDSGYGYHDPATGAVGAWNQEKTFLEYFVPVLEDLGYPMPPASHHQEAGYQLVWNNIGDLTAPGPGFNDTVLATPYHNSGCGLQWDLNFPGVQPPNDFIEFGTDWCFLEVQEPPPPEFVPEPRSVLLLAGGLMGLAGYAGLRARKR